MTEQDKITIESAIKTCAPSHLNGLRNGWLDIEEGHDGYQKIFKIFTRQNGDKKLIMKLGK